MDDFISYSNSPVRREYEEIFLELDSTEPQTHSFDRGLTPDTGYSLEQKLIKDEDGGSPDSPFTPQKVKREDVSSKHRFFGNGPIGAEQTRQTKNIVKNYGNAIVGFAISSLAVPYLEHFSKHESFKISDFQKYFARKKGSISGISTFRTLLEESEKDTSIERVYKRIFRELAVVFVKYFSVNWIFSGKLKHKIAHLKFRYPILRRIQKPELFTYLKN
jgi:hypothetical protein